MTPKKRKTKRKFVEKITGQTLAYIRPVKKSGKTGKPQKVVITTTRVTPGK